MKHLLLLALLLLLAPAAGAQSANPAIWCPVGATWQYDYILFTERGTLTVQYTGDQMVNGQPAQVLQRTLTTYYYFGPGQTLPAGTRGLTDVVTRVVGDRVEVMANGQFYTLYDFGTVPGSSWLTAPVTPQGACPQGVVVVTVDSVGRQLVAGRSLRWFRAHLTAGAGTTSAGAWLGRIYEQLGNVAQYMQPQSPICRGSDPGYMGSMSTFRATGWPAIGYNATSGTLLSTQARAEAAGFAVYPNPSAGAGRLSVALTPATSPTGQLSLLDLTGRLILQQPEVSGQLLDVRGVAAGTYTLLLRAPGQPVLAQRLVLE